MGNKLKAEGAGAPRLAPEGLGRGPQREARLWKRGYCEEPPHRSSAEDLEAPSVGGWGKQMDPHGREALKNGSGRGMRWRRCPRWLTTYLLNPEGVRRAGRWANCDPKRHGAQGGAGTRAARSSNALSEEERRRAESPGQRSQQGYLVGGES